MEYYGGLDIFFKSFEVSKGALKEYIAKENNLTRATNFDGIKLAEI